MKRLIVLMLFIAACSSNTELSTLSAGSSDKQQMLNARLDKFNKAMYWNSSSELVQYLDPGYLETFLKNISKRPEGEELVESKIKSLNFFDNSSKATAYIETRFFNKQTLYVNSRYEKLDWEFFRLDGGWRLKNIDQLSEEHFAHLINE